MIVTVKTSWSFGRGRLIEQSASTEVPEPDGGYLRGVREQLIRELGGALLAVVSIRLGPSSYDRNEGTQT